MELRFKTSKHVNALTEMATCLAFSSLYENINGDLKMREREVFRAKLDGLFPSKKSGKPQPLGAYGAKTEDLLRLRVFMLNIQERGEDHIPEDIETFMKKVSISAESTAEEKDEIVLTLKNEDGSPYTGDVVFLDDVIDFFFPEEEEETTADIEIEHSPQQESVPTTTPTGQTSPSAPAAAPAPDSSFLEALGYARQHFITGSLLQKTALQILEEHAGKELRPQEKITSVEEAIEALTGVKEAQEIVGLLQMLKEELSSSSTEKEELPGEVAEAVAYTVSVMAAVKVTA